jgi:exonuclease SbcC
VDFDRLPALLAVTGPNGAGKTTLLDVITAGFWLTMPFRPTALHRQFPQRGIIETVWSTNGCRYRSDVRVDPGSGRTEANLFDLDHGVHLAGPLARDYKPAVEAIVGPLEAALASMYAVQRGTGAFLRLPRADRKALLVEMLGLTAFPAWEEAARERARTLLLDLRAVNAQVATLEPRAARRADLEARQAALALEMSAARARLEAAEAEAHAATADAVKAREALAALEPVRKSLTQCVEAAGTATTKLEDARTRAKNNEGLLVREPEIAQAIERAGTLRREIEELDGRLAAAREPIKAVEAGIETARAAYETAQAAYRDAAVAGRDLEHARTEKTGLERQAGLVATVPCRGEGDYAACAFLKDATAAQRRIPAVQERIGVLEALPPPVAPEDPGSALRAERTTLQRALDDVTAVWQAKQRDLNGLSAALAMEPKLAQARARLEELRTQITDLERFVAEKTTEQTDLTAQLNTLPAIEESQRLAQRTANAAEERQRAAHGDIARLERDAGEIDAGLADVSKAEAEVSGLRERIGPMEEDLADWVLITKILGPAGLPALLIDQALPEINRLATDLLRECFGESVFSIQMTTQRESADESKLLETLDVVVTRGGEPMDAMLLSGGEEVLVAESLSLAIALFNAGRSGRRYHTLLRDEVGAPLDPAKAPAYVRMLRGAARVGGFSHVLFVTHQQSCVDLADARLNVGNSTVVVS